MTTRTLRPVAEVTVAGTTVDASEGGSTLDAMSVPYATASVTMPLIDVADVELVDPRDNVRATIVAGDEDAGTSRTFDLGVRSRTIDHKAKTIQMELASDEALLQDYAPLDDIDLWDYRESLRDVIDEVLGTVIPGAALEAGDADADVTPRWEQTNLILNARGATNTDGWAKWVSDGVDGTVTAGTTSIVQEGAAFGSYLRLSVTSAGTGNAELRYGNTVDDSPVVSAGRLYTFSAWVHQTSGVTKNGRLLLTFRNGAYAALPGVNRTVSVPTDTWTKISETAVAHVKDEYAVLTAGISNGMPASSAVGVTAAVLAEGVRNDRWFDGSRVDDAYYTYDWTPDALITPSVRVPVGGEIDPDVLTWRAGTTAWEFLAPLTAIAGLRLYCDEQRVWRLIDPDTFFAPGRLSVSPLNSTEGTDTVSRDNPEVYCTGVIVKYTWTDQQGVTRTQTDTAGLPGRVLVIELERAFPGTGVAAAMLNRRTGQGRLQEATCLANWDALPSQQISISLPGTLDQLGQLEAVEWGLTNGLMRVRTRALTDIIPGSINALVGIIDDLVGTINDL